MGSWSNALTATALALELAGCGKAAADSGTRAAAPPTEVGPSSPGDAAQAGAGPEAASNAPPSDEASSDATPPGDVGGDGAPSEGLPPDGGPADGAPADRDAGCSGQATIANTGSTNSAGYDVTVDPSGATTWQSAPQRSIRNALSCAPPQGSTVLPAALTARFFADLDVAPLSTLQFESCPKSASFGSFTRLVYCGTTIPDTQCGSTTDLRAQAVTQDVNDIVSAVVDATCVDP